MGLADWPAPPGAGAGTGTVVGVAGVAGVLLPPSAGGVGRVRPVPAACLDLPAPAPPSRDARPDMLPPPRLPPNSCNILNFKSKK